MPKILIGIVASDKVDKTIVVTVHNSKTHPIYRKQFTTSKKFMAHDEANEARVGDKVSIAETRPLSARKRFILVKVLEKAPVRHTEEESPVKEKSVTRDKQPETAVPEEKK